MIATKMKCIKMKIAIKVYSQKENVLDDKIWLNSKYIKI